ncbi:MAG: abortive infection protein [Bacteroidetes bacterium]|nr:MAG: abortive infection protein [Bacteroidota bacterium]
MKTFFGYFRDYFNKVSFIRLLLTTTLVAILIFVNYHWGIESRIKRLPGHVSQLLVFYIFYLSVFGIAYFISLFNDFRVSIIDRNNFFLLLLVAPFFFALKMVEWRFFFLNQFDPAWQKYWTIVLQWPIKLGLLIIVLWLLLPLNHKLDSFWGLTVRDLKIWPYVFLLLCIVPFILLASAQRDFLLAYPKFKNILFLSPYVSTLWPWKLLFEISYGLDFLSIELFFRGFLVIGFARFVDWRAILPMAAFYCTIHFGKPWGECVSSYLGGAALGIIAFRTETIVGGLLVHLGIAYAMELGGWIHLFG